jgi:gamma-glutamyl-gamma-aminobutyrate hydrolase PuuD
MFQDLVEGCYHREHHILAVQWHPEREGASRNLDDFLFHRFKANDFWELT